MCKRADGAQMFWKRRRTSSTVDILTAAQFRFLETMMILILGVLTDEQEATIKETIRWRLGRMHEVPIPTFIPPAGAQSYRDALSGMLQIMLSDAESLTRGFGGNGLPRDRQ
jgi:hypothetical protein